MALVTETGTGSATAESYCSVTDADTYFSNRSNTTWAALTTAAKETALRKATDYMSQLYRSRWISYRYTTTQALDWPRASVTTDNGQRTIDADEVPVEVIRACAELADRASTATLLADESRAKIRTKVGPLETEYAEFSPQTKRYLAIDAMLAPLLTGSANSMTVVRR